MMLWSNRWIYYLAFMMPTISAEVSDSPTLLSKIERLEQSLKFLEATSNRVEQLERSQNELKQEVDSLRVENRKLRLEMDHCTCNGGNNFKLNKRLLEGSTEPAIAFSAYINHSMDHLAPGTAIPFETVTTNEGNAFHGPTGLFTCPRNGLYLFVWNIAVDPGHATLVRFLVNGKIHRWSNAGSSQHWTNGANHDVVRLQIGDRVWITGGSTDGEIHPHHTTFSGVLISQ